tara:strand:- start:512 stop:673 length:162 start_codon:yes stop_codon:yes gene_type:complete
MNITRSATTWVMEEEESKHFGEYLEGGIGFSIVQVKRAFGREIEKRQRDDDIK